MVHLIPSAVIRLHIAFFEHSVRAIRSQLSSAKLNGCLIVAVWLALVQPGMSGYWLIDPAVHARIDAELYGQLPDGETLPGHEPQLPHEHSIILGTAVSGLTLVNPFGAAFYCALLTPAQRLARLDRRAEPFVIPQSITLTPPDQPPRPAA